MSEPRNPSPSPSRRRCHALALAFAALAAMSLHGNAQQCGSAAGSPLSTDRPQFTNASTVVPCGSLQVENGFLLTGTNPQRTLDLPETALRLGIAGKTELRFSIPDYFHPGSPAPSAPSGLGDSAVGVKQQFGPVEGYDLSVMATLSLPTGAANLTSGGYDFSLQSPWSRAAGKNWTVAGQFGLAWPTISSRHAATGEASLYLDRQLTAKIDAYGEYSGTFPQRGGPQHLVDFGAACKVAAHQQIDLHGGFGLGSQTPNYFLGLGYSIRFQLRHAPPKRLP